MNIRQQFRQSIRCGTGKAHFILRDNPTIDFSKDIIKAALTNLAFDAQAEGDRAYYVACLINLSNKKAEIVAHILDALATEQEDAWALDQLFELAAIFAKEGNKKARQAIYKRYHKHVISGSAWCGEDAIVELDGIEGLKYIAETRGKALINDPDDWEDGFFVDGFQEENPELKVYDELENAAEDNPYIRKYLDAIAECKRLRSERPRRPKYNYQTVTENIENKKVVPLPLVGVKELTKTDIRRLADDFLKVTDPLKQEKYLRIFARTRYPYDYQPILQIAKGRYSRDNRRVEFACEALQYFQAKDIRQFAIEKLDKINKPADYLYLLVANYKRGDYKLLTKTAAKYKDEDIIHSLVWGYIDIYKANSTQECKQPLELIYEKLTCGLHRYDIVEILYKNGVLSDRILREIEFDSYDEIRDLHKRIKDEPLPPSPSLKVGRT